jgi:hypothetical protein
VVSVQRGKFILKKAKIAYNHYDESPWVAAATSRISGPADPITLPRTDLESARHNGSRHALLNG